jgi:GNAT superfamily N-acetyltransferase
MWPRLEGNYRDRTGESNRRSIKRVVDTAPAPPGVLAYVDGDVVGWCAVAPREQYPKLAKSRATAPIDNEAVWSVVCFSVLRGARRRGVSRALLSAAVELAAAHGAETIEAYPVERTLNTFRGYTSVYRDAGFEEVLRRHPDHPILRYRVRRRPRRPRSAAAESSRHMKSRTDARRAR